MRTCSLNIIAKNEEENIRNCLSSAFGERGQDLFDQIVVVDTGSTDDTAAIAWRVGAKVIEFPWIDDFSAARNAAIDASDEDWIFWMDADDTIDSDSIKTLKLMIQGQDMCVFAKLVSDLGNGHNSEVMQARAFPRRPDIRFRRRIHEQIASACADAGLPMVAAPGIRVCHSGYSEPGAVIAKMARNLPLIEAEIAATPAFEPDMHLALGNCHIRLGNVSAAAAAYRGLVNRENFAQSHKDIYVEAMFNLACIEADHGRADRARGHLLRCLELDGERVDAHLVLGSIARAAGSREKARFHFEKAMSIKPRIKIAGPSASAISEMAERQLRAL